MIVLPEFGNEMGTATKKLYFRNCNWQRKENCNEKASDSKDITETAREISVQI